MDTFKPLVIGNLKAKYPIIQGGMGAVSYTHLDVYKRQAYVTDASQVKPLLTKQVSSSVRWQQSVETMLADGVDTLSLIHIYYGAAGTWT